MVRREFCAQWHHLNTGELKALVLKEPSYPDVAHKRCPELSASLRYVGAKLLGGFRKTNGD